MSQKIKVSHEADYSQEQSTKLQNIQYQLQFSSNQNQHTGVFSEILDDQTIFYTVKAQTPNTFFQTYDMPFPQTIRQFTRWIAKGDFCSLRVYWCQSNHNIREKISFIVENWKFFSNQYRYCMELLLATLVNRFQSHLSEIVFPGLQKLKKELKRVVNARQDGACKNVANMLFRHYADQIDSKNKGEAMFLISEQIQGKNTNVDRRERFALSEYIRRHPDFSHPQEWQRLLYQTYIHKLLQQEYSKNFPEAYKKCQRLRDLSSFLTSQTGINFAVESNNLCCTRILYANCNIQFGSHISGCIPLIVDHKSNDLLGLRGKQKQKQNAKKQLKKVSIQVVSLLNSGGGIILFDTHKKYLQVIPEGDLIIHQNQVTLKNILYQHFKERIFPKHKKSQSQVKISFVPVASTPIPTDKLYNKYKNAFIPGQYVMRIVVVPKFIDRLYYYLAQNQKYQNYHFFNGKSCNLSPKKAVRLFKKKINSYYIPQCQYSNEQEKAMLRQTAYGGGRWIQQKHICVQPQAGIVLFNNQIDPHKSQIVDLQKNYKHMTLLITQHKNHPNIKNSLKTKNIQCQIKTCYTNHNLKAANNSAILFHHVPFKQLNNVVGYNSVFKFDTRQVLIINICQYIQVIINEDKKLQEYQFGILNDWLSKEHLHFKEKIAYYSYDPRTHNRNDPIQYYLKTQTKMNALLMYFVLNHLGFKCFFKNIPNNVQKSWILLLPRKSA